MRPDETSDDTWYLLRDGNRFGPYSWEALWQMGAEGLILPDDLIWSPTLGNWTPAREIASLWPLADTPPPEARPRGRLLFALAGAFAVVAIVAAAVLLVMHLRGASIDNYYPKEGPAGSYVVLETSRRIEPDRVSVRYGDTPLSVTGLSERCLGVMLPLDAKSGALRLFDGDRELDSVEFNVTRPVATGLLRETITPSPTDRVVTSAAGISVRIPGGLIPEARTLSITRIENAAVPRDNPFEPIEVIDVSIDGIEQLDGVVEIGVPYDPAKLDPRIPVDSNFAPARWDEENKRWVDLYYRVDESTNTVYFVTDHLSAFWTGFSLVGLGQTTAIVTAAGTVIGEVAERWANDKYLSRHRKIRILYSDKALRTTFPDDQWKKAIAPASLYAIDYYDPKYSAAVQDVAHVLEESLDRYVAAGFPDPTKKTFLGVHVYNRYVKVKIDSLYNYYAQQGEMAHDSFWDTIHLPTEILRLEFFDPATSGAGTFEEHFLIFKGLLAHELFHVVQREYYGMMTTFTGTPHTWWREATAEWAAHDLAKIPNRPGWEKDSPSIHKRIGPKFLQVPINARGKFPGTATVVGGLDYEYLASVFVRYLVREKGFAIKDLVVQVAKDDASDPLMPIRRLAVRESGETFDDFYGDFAAWLVRHAELPLSSFGNPKNTNIAATRSDVVNVAAPETLLRVYRTGATGGASTPRVTLFRSEDGRERLTMRDTPLLVIEESRPNVYELSGTDGDILYFVAGNGSQIDVSFGLTIQRLNRETWETAASTTMKIGRNGTAAIWAVKVSSATLEIDPESIADAKGYESYRFDVRAKGLAPEITSASFEWDFGDGLATSKGTSKANVREGEAAIAIDHAYEPSPGASAEALPLKRVLTVRLLDGSNVIATATAEITVAKAELVVMPRRLVASPGDTFEFEATARPSGRYRFAWTLPGNGAKQVQEGERSSVSFAVPGAGEHPVTVELYSMTGVLLATDTVVAASVSDDATSAATGDAAGGGSAPATPGGAWELVEVVDYSQAPGDSNYRLSYGRGSIGWRWTMNKDAFGFNATWSPPPQVIRPGERVEMSFAVAVTEDTGDDYFAGGTFSMFFDRPEVEPGSVISPIHFTNDAGESANVEVRHREKSPPVSRKVWASLPAGQPGDRLALLVDAYNGRSAGTKYIYEWKAR